VPVVRVDASTALSGLDAGAPVVCAGCQCPAVANVRVRPLTNIPRLEHAAVCNRAIHCKAHVRTEGRRIKKHATPEGFGPSDLASAYKLNPKLMPGATIAIVDA
jgi:hypothetical protein